MSEPAAPSKAQKSPMEEKTKNSQKPKVVTVYPPKSREISPDLYYPTDRYRLSAPLFPDPGAVKISEPE